MTSLTLSNQVHQAGHAQALQPRSTAQHSTTGLRAWDSSAHVFDGQPELIQLPGCSTDMPLEPH